MTEMIRYIWRPCASGWRSDGNWYLPRRSALWLRLKATICLLLGWWTEDGYMDDMFILARYDYSEWLGEYGTHRGWSELMVKVKGWGIAEGSDGAP